MVQVRALLEEGLKDSKLPQKHTQIEKETNTSHQSLQEEYLFQVISLHKTNESTKLLIPTAELERMKSMSNCPNLRSVHLKDYAPVRPYIEDLKHTIVWVQPCKSLEAEES